MKSFALFAAVLFGSVGIATTAGAVTAASPDIVQITVSVPFTSGAGFSPYAQILTVPSNKRLVVQEISYWRSGAALGSISSVFVNTNIFGVYSYIPGPNVTADGSPYPTGSLSTTFYAGAGATIYVGGYRTGSLTNSETLEVTLSGYYVLRD